MGLRFSYTLLAPFYDALVAAPTETVRATSLQRLQNCQGKKVLINGIGSGLDIPHLPTGPDYTGTDLTAAMLKKADRRATLHQIPIKLFQADSQQLPFDKHIYDIVVMHFILAVVPDPITALREASRVLKPGGRIFIMDKFIRPEEKAVFRRLINPVMRQLATRTDVVFEQVHSHCKELLLIEDKAIMMNGWFRSIELKKESTE